MKAPKLESFIATEAEKALAGALVVYPAETVGALNDAGFEAEALQLPVCRRIFEFVRGAVGRGEPCGFVEIVTDLQRHQPGITPALVTDLTAHVGDGSRVKAWAQAVRDMSLRRETIQHVQAQLDILGTNSDLSEVLESTKSWIQQKQRAHMPPRSFMLRDLLAERLEAYGRPDEGRIVKTGYCDFDERVTLERSDFVVVGGGTGSGKSMFGINLVLGILAEGPGAAMIASLEMSAEQVTERIVARTSGVSTGRLKRREWTEHDMQRIGAAAARLATLPLVIRDDCHSLHQITAAARAVHANKGLRVLMVDYLQLVRGPSAELREQQVAAVSRELRLLALETGALVIGLAQLNKAGEARESSAIMMDATQFLTVRLVDTEGKPWRPDDDEAELDETRRRIEICKQRDGSVGHLLMGFDGAQAKFHDCEQLQKKLAKFQR